MKPDLLICWIKHCDYPIFRYTLRKYRDFFGKVIVYWSEHNQFPYFDHHIHESLKDLDILFLDPTFTDWSIGEDWRNHATNEMLKYSTSEWVCSIEQDWFCRDWDKFFSNVLLMQQKADLFGWMNQTAHPYIHPACWFMKREALEKTSKDFSPHSEINGSDHFAMITYDTQKNEGNVSSMESLNMDFSPGTDCFHGGGINQNIIHFHQRFKEGVLHRPEMFYIYNYYSLQCPVSQSEYFVNIMKEIGVFLKSKYPEINPEAAEWSQFFNLW